MSPASVDAVATPVAAATPEVRIYKWHPPYQIPAGRLNVPAVTKRGAPSGKYDPKPSLIKSRRHAIQLVTVAA